uniref:Guanine nucleotide-binding protein subunit beta-like protein n=1 Tax=Palpitomonas bilix TaxID=652834 RepID=A0A7S3GD94_9EUKA|mmetsp:Transcript_44380/g.115332  ORF Transcript_44380/g.115332 Transcript_44380/m.115332 type:complete len:577 (+) Transcript_44380:61-1791(+)
MAGEIPFELEHLIGLSTKSTESYVVHPVEKSKVVYSVGSTLVFGDLKDPHNQTLLSSHDSPITTIRVAPKGSRIFTAESATGGQRKLIVWDWTSRKQIAQLAGLQGEVLSASFSPDDRFLVAGDEKGMLCVWDLQTLHVCAYVRFDRPCENVCWGLVGELRRMPSYTFATCSASSVKVHLFDYDVRSLQYQISSTHPMAVPSTGLKRHFRGGFITEDGRELIVGTEAGEIIVFNMENRVFRHAINVGANGIVSAVFCNTESDGRVTILAGAGDGRIHRICGRDTVWEVQAQIAMDGAVISIGKCSLTGDGDEYIAATAAGMVYNIDGSLKRRSPLSYAHRTSVTSVAFPSDSMRSERCVTGSADGLVRVWDLSDYSIKCTCRVRMRGVAGPVEIGAVKAVVFLEDANQIVAAYGSGSIVVFDASSGDEIFKVHPSHLRFLHFLLSFNVIMQIPEAHRNGATTLCCTDSFLVSGGVDGAVRVWTRKSFSFVAQFTDHSRSIERVFTDVAAANLVHSIGADRVMVTYDLSRERKTHTHMLTVGGAFTSGSQRSDHETEIYTAGNVVEGTVCWCFDTFK